MQLIPSGLKKFLTGDKYSDLDYKVKDESYSPQLESYKQRVYPSDGVVTKVHNVLDANEVTARFKGAFIADGDYYSNSELLKLVDQEVTNKAELSEKLSQIRDFEYIESSLRDLATDVLTKSYNESSGQFFTFRMLNEDHKNLEEDINKLIKDLKLYEVLTDVCEDFLFEGQYILKSDIENKQIEDTLVQNEVLPAYQKGELVKVYDRSKQKLFSPKTYLVLNLFSSHKKVRIRTKDETYTLKLPRGIVSESLIGKINNLKLLEALQPLIEMQAVDEKMYFYVRFAPGKDTTEAYKEARDYERLIKSMLSMDKANTIDQVVDRVSKVKVIPLFGNQEEIKQQTISKVNRIELAQVNDLRNSISKSMKINIAGDNESNKEYNKLIKRVRLCIRNSVSEYLKIVIKEKFEVLLTNDDYQLIVPEVRGVDELEVIDYISMSANASKEILGMINNMNNMYKSLTANPRIDKELLLQFFNDKLNPLVNSDVFLSDDALKEKGVTDAEIKEINKLDSTPAEDVEIE